MELMIVIAIIMILSGAIVARIGTGGEKAKIAKAKAEMEEIASAARAFYADTGVWPISTQWYDPVYCEDGLINKDNLKLVCYENGFWTGDSTVIAGAKSNWKGPYLDAAIFPTDPWIMSLDGTRKVYYRIGGEIPVQPQAKRLYILSPGPDRNFNTNLANDLDGKTDPTKDDLVVLVHVFNK